MGMNDDQWDLALLDDGTYPHLWEYHESMDDLKRKLLCTMESLRSNEEELMIKDEELKIKDIQICWKDEEIRRKDAELMRKDEEINQLSQLLEFTIQERDSSRHEMQQLLNKITQQSTPLAPVHLQIDSPPLVPTRGGGSDITESDNHHHHNHHHHHHHHSLVSSPVDFDSVNSSPGIAKYDKASWIIDALAMKKPLPEKGKLLQAVQAVTLSTPLLETLLMTGSLPEWRNPPPAVPFHVPPPLPTTAKGCANGVLFVKSGRLGLNAVSGLRHERPQGCSSYRMLGAKRQMTQ